MDLLEKSKNNQRHPWELARYEVIKSLLGKHVYDYAGKKVLDLGCGDLFFLNEFAKDKPDADFYAIDTAFTKDFIDSEAKTTNIKLFNSTLELSNEDEIKFDIIFLMDVIEHIEDDKAFLLNIKEKFCIPGQTHIIITVPAFQQLFCYHDNFLGHYRRYTNTNLKEVVKNADFKPLENGYFFIGLLAPRAFEVLKERILGQKETSGTRLTSWNQGHIVTNTIKHLLILDFKISKFFRRAGLNLPGLSNYLICKI